MCSSFFSVVYLDEISLGFVNWKAHWSVIVCYFLLFFYGLNIYVSPLLSTSWFRFTFMKVPYFVNLYMLLNFLSIFLQCHHNFLFPRIYDLYFPSGFLLSCVHSSFTAFSISVSAVSLFFVHIASMLNCTNCHHVYFNLFYIF